MCISALVGFYLYLIKSSHTRSLSYLMRTRIRYALDLVVLVDFYLYLIKSSRTRSLSYLMRMINNSFIIKNLTNIIIRNELKYKFGKASYFNDCSFLKLNKYLSMY